MLITLVYEQGKTIEEAAEVINAELIRRGEDDSVSRESVRRSMIALKDASPSADARRMLAGYLAESTPNDLDTLDEIKAYFLDLFRNFSTPEKSRRYAALDLLKVLETKLKMATALDGGDKTQIAMVVKNEIGKIADGMAAGGGIDMALFRDAPAEFCKLILGETITDDIRQVMESVRDNPVTIARSANATGKTHGAARIAVWWYKAFEHLPGEVQVYTAAAPPEGNLKRLLWGEIGAVKERHPDLFKGDTLQSLNISRGARDFITGVTIPTSGTAEQREGKFSGKHAAYLLFIVDEGDAVPDEVYRGIESCMSGGMARLLIMFNPRGARGTAFEMEEKGAANVIELSAFRHPNVTTGKDMIPGAVTREMTIRRIHNWTRPLAGDETPDNECFEIPDFLVGATALAESGEWFPPLEPGWRKVVEPAFWYMVLGKYPPVPAAQLVAPDWIAAARSRYDAYVAEHGETPPVGAVGKGGFDVAESNDSNALCRRYGGFVPPLKTWTGTDTLDSSEQAAAWAQEHSLGIVLVDATGLGSSCAPILVKRGVKACGVKVAEKATKHCDLGEFFDLRCQLLWEMREWLRVDPGAMLPPDKLLIEELSLPDYWKDEKGRVRVMGTDAIRDRLRRSPDRMSALMLTFAEPKLCYPELR